MIIILLQKEKQVPQFFSPFSFFVKMQTIGKFFKEAKRQDESLYTVFSKTMYIQRHILLQKPRPNTELKDITD